MNRLQHTLAGNRYIIYAGALYALVVWLLAGLVKEQWWIQAGCFFVSVILMMILNNQNLLIRVFSRMVSTVFIFLFCAAVFLFPSLPGGIIQVLTIGSLWLLYRCYQDKLAKGLTFYLFICLCLASIVDIRFLYYVPLFWCMMAIITYSLSWRTFFTSLLGFCTPLWFLLGWYSFHKVDFVDLWTPRLLQLADFQFIGQYAVIAPRQLSYFVFLVLLLIIGFIHFVRTSYLDKIRVRQIYYSFFLIAAYSCFLLAIQPTFFDLVCRIMIIAVSPVIAHFYALTNTRLTNITFIILNVLTILITGMNLWISLSLS